MDTGRSIWMSSTWTSARPLVWCPTTLLPLPYGRQNPWLIAPVKYWSTHLWGCSGMHGDMVGSWGAGTTPCYGPHGGGWHPGLLQDVQRCVRESRRDPLVLAPLPNGSFPWGKGTEESPSMIACTAGGDSALGTSWCPSELSGSDLGLSDAIASFWCHSLLPPGSPSHAGTERFSINGF